MKQTKKKLSPKRLALICLVAAAVLACLIAGVLFACSHLMSYGFAREVPEAQRQQRLELVAAAQAYLGCSEADGSHQQIIDLYNRHTPLAQGYMVQYSDNWCATFGSVAAIDCGFTDIIPTECGCQRQIGLFQELGCWVEEDDYVPLPGDYIFYCRSDSGIGDCTGWSDHVGIVVGTAGPFIKVIEGNCANQVMERIIRIDAKTIRGFGIPAYG